jgi:large subunit ribosomal protein L29
MAVIDAKSLREKTSQELQDQLMLEKKCLFDGKVKSASGEATKPHETRAGRRLIARIRCILRERELRAELDKEIAVLTPKAKSAAPKFARVLKDVQERNAAIKAELEKPIGKRKYKPVLKRVRARHVGADEITPADRAAIYLAEASRKRAGLERVDVGQGK